MNKHLNIQKIIEDLKKDIMKNDKVTITNDYKERRGMSCLCIQMNQHNKLKEDKK